MDADSVNNASASHEDVQDGELEAESNNMDSLEVMSSSGGIMRGLESAREVLTRIELDLACSSEKLLNLDILVMHVAARESDFESFLSEKEQTFGDSAKNALEFDFLSGILESELKELENFLLSIQMEIANASEIISSCKNLGEASKEMQEKLHDCEKSLKQSLEQVSELMVQSDNFNRILSTFAGGKNDKNMECLENGYFSDMNLKLRMQTAEQQRHVLRMFEKSLARELDLEKKLTELRQSEEVMKIRLQQEVFCIEEEVEVSWEHLFEAENSSEVFLGTSKELMSKLQIVQFSLNGYIQREGELRSKCEGFIEQIKAKNSALQNSENTNAELREKVNSLEKQLKESELQLGHLKGLAAEKQEADTNSQVEDLVRPLREKVSEAESRAGNAEAECKQLRDTNMELNQEVSQLKSSNTSISERVDLLEKQLRECDIQLQHAVASAEASLEKQTMLYSTIKDMEHLIDDLKSKVSKAESRTESAEDKCIILSESNSDLNEELNFLRSRMEYLEASLHQVEETKKATAKEISIRTKLITEMIMQLALERERLHTQISLLTREKKVLLKRLQHWTKDHCVPTTNDVKGSNKDFTHSMHDFSSVTSVEETKGETSEILASGHELQMDMAKNVPMGKAEMGLYDSGSKFDSVRNIDARLLNFEYVLVAIFVVAISALVASLLGHYNDLH